MVVAVVRGNQNGDTALLLACFEGRLEVARWLVAECGCDAQTEHNSVSCRCPLESLRRACAGCLVQYFTGVDALCCAGGLHGHRFCVHRATVECCAVADGRTRCGPGTLRDCVGGDACVCVFVSEVCAHVAVCARVVVCVNRSTRQRCTNTTSCGSR